MIQAETGHWIEVTDLSPRLRKIEGTVTRIAPKQGTLKEMMEQVERWLIAEALRDHGNNKTKTAVDPRHHARGPAQEAREVRRLSRIDSLRQCGSECRGAKRAVGSRMALTLYVGSKRYSSWSLRPYLALAHTGARVRDHDDPARSADSQGEDRCGQPGRPVPVLHDDEPRDLGLARDLRVRRRAVSGREAVARRSRARAPARARSAPRCTRASSALRRDMPMDLLADKPGIGHTPEALADARRVHGDLARGARAPSGGPFLFGASRSPTRCSRR